METKSGFTLMELNEFDNWLGQQNITRNIRTVQQHHTWLPDYSNFNGDNHFRLQESMKDSHLARGFSFIAQHFTTYPDGKICTGRQLNKIPAGIKGANTGSICIENIGNFDKNKDVMSAKHKKSIIGITAALLKHFGIEANIEGIRYPHWIDLNTGKRTDGAGSTKTCPGSNFFGGNTVKKCQENFIPLVKSKMKKVSVDDISDSDRIISTGQVTSDNLNVRSGPSSQHSIVDVLNRGVEVNCYKVKGSWWRIHPNRNRWVFKNYVLAIANMSEDELNDLFIHNATEINKLKIAAGGMVKSLIMELKRRNTYIKLHDAVKKGHKVNYVFIEGEKDLVSRIARALGFKRVTKTVLEVRNA